MIVRAIDSLQTDIFVTAKEQREWSFCPIDGGFDFTAKLNGIKKVNIGTICLSLGIRTSRVNVTINVIVEGVNS